MVYSNRLNMNTLLFFIFITLLNIITATIKTVVIVKSGPVLAGLISTINATINAVSTLTIARQEDPVIVIAVTLIANAVAVPTTKFILNKLEKDKLWVYDATIRTTQEKIEEFRSYLKDMQGIHSTWTAISEDHLYSMKIFVYTKNESRIVKSQLSQLNAKYHIIEPR